MTDAQKKAIEEMNAYKATHGGDLTGMQSNYRLNVPGVEDYDPRMKTFIKKRDGGGKVEDDSGGGGGGATGYGSIMAAYQSLLEQQRARQEDAARLKQQAAQAAYDKNMGYLTDAYAKRGELLKGNYDDTLAQLQGQYDYGAQGVNQNADRAQQQAYINYMMSKRDLPQQLSALGINGGASESRLAGLYNSYGNARNEVDTGRNSDLAMLLNTLNQNKSSALQNYNSAMSDDDARKLAYQMELEQNLSNGTAQILTDKYSALNELDSTYAQQMAALQQAQAQAAAKAASSSYDAGNEGSSISTEQAEAIRKSPAYKLAENLFVNGGSSPYEIQEALESQGINTTTIDQILYLMGL